MNRRSRYAAGEHTTLSFSGRAILDSLEVWVLDGDKFKTRSNYETRRGGNGFGLCYDNVCYTLTAVDRHMVAVAKRRRSQLPNPEWLGLVGERDCQARAD